MCTVTHIIVIFAQLLLETLSLKFHIYFYFQFFSIFYFNFYLLLWCIYHFCPSLAKCPSLINSVPIPLRPSTNSNTTTTKPLQPHSLKVNKPRPNENPSIAWKLKSMKNPRWATMTWPTQTNENNEVAADH